LREPTSLTLIAIPDYVRYGLFNSLRAFRGMVRYPTAERLGRLPAPFLTIIGSRDPLVSERQMTRLLQSPAEMHLMCHFDAAHAINFSHPEALARLVDAYLRGESLRELAETHHVIGYVDAANALPSS
jgi:pimeloyl-ACP methyl ester carboxylesterase